MSTLNVSNITDGTTTVGTSYVVNGSAKAWVTFNGTGTVAILDGFNSASIVDAGTGAYNVNISSAMSDANYALTEGSRSYQTYTNRSGLNTVSLLAVGCANASGAATDVAYVSLLASGDLA